MRKFSLGMTVVLSFIGCATAYPAFAQLTISSASWDSGDRRLTVRGTGDDNEDVTVRNAYQTTQVLGTDEVDGDGDWRVRRSRPSPVPCAVQASAPGDTAVVRAVSNAPSTCSPKAPQQNVCNIAVTPTALAFGNVNVGSNAARSTTLTNTGTAACALTVARTGTTEFALTTPATINVAIGGSATVSATYTPTAAGADTGNLAISGSGITTVNVAMTGTGVAVQPQACAITVNPTSLAFGNVNVGANAARSTTVTNTGTAACALSVARTGTTEFALTTPASINVAVGGTATVSATYTPAAAGGDTGNLAITGSGITTVNAAMTGTGVAVQAQCDPGIRPEHCSITEYTGPEVCVGCHRAEAEDMHGSVHYQQGGDFPNVPNIPTGFYAAGERPAHPAGTSVATGVNTYCGTHENSPRFTCAGCHVGNGRFPLNQEEFVALPPDDQLHELANIDCLMCHQDVYKRFPDWTTNGYGFTPLTLVNVAEEINSQTGKLELVHRDDSTVIRDGYAGIPNVDLVTQDFQFLPAGSDTLPAKVPMAPMAVTTLEAAQTVHPTTRQSCLNCHAGAAGADGAKRGDLSKELAQSATPTLDYHMSPQGADQTCSDCHSATLSDGTGHRVRGRGLDLRANDVPERFTCDSGGCHSSNPHPATTSVSNTGNRLNRHTGKVACQTCHIPRYAKAAVGTEVARDWQDPHPSNSACNGRGGWLPREDKGFNLTPSYNWFDGKSDVYYLGEPLTGVPTIQLTNGVADSFGLPRGGSAYVLGIPTAILNNTSGAIDQKLGAGNSAAKIYPMKEHWGKLASNGSTLIGHSTFEFFRTGSFCRAVAIGENQNPDDACPVGVPGPEMPFGIDAVAVHTFQTINHGVEPTTSALQCGACHASQGTGPLRMELEGQLGYELKEPATSNGLCNNCHGGETPPTTNATTSIHERSQHRSRPCSDCHVRR